ncbi:response regulator receiver and ANTAR domain protein [Aquabacterium commune]|uniref:Response regulator receiver and ANTAR domain protein n=1 Tax=Aquabacterium commune TaxID=70586 RepID=A0A4R6RDQ0_9BURK|nr:response regulator [Aquabacterium commune]TDP83816.1 response regulator receiver and ANTAR domain protein [Aquabacterium commune]
MNQKGKILVVDDDRLVLATLTHGLSQAGFEVIDADNGDDAILLAREHRPELALLDIRMEGKSGFDVAAYLREYLQTPFMFLSAFADEGTIKQVKELGALTYLVKPLDIQQIVPAVEAAFANRPKAQAAKAAEAAKASVGTPAAHPSTEAVAPATSADPLTATVAIAIGLVMHRHSLTRRQALDKLSLQARQENLSVAAVCERLINAQEVLAGLGSL